MNIINLSLKVLEPKRRIFEAATKEPLKAQEHVLFEYLRRSAKTEYGRTYDFASIKSIDEYRKRVPLVDYEDIREHVDRMAAGEENILTRDKPIFFGATSGTTDKPKLIPVTRYSESQNDSLLNLWSYYIARDHPDVTDGKILAIVSPEKEGETPSGVLLGAESGHSYRNLPKTVMALYSLPYEVFEIEDYEARHYAMLRISMGQEITDIATLNPNTIVLLCRKIERWQDLIIKDIAEGTLSEKFEIPERIRKNITIRLKPDKRRAEKLSTILRSKGKLLPRDFWPKMKMIECWMGGMMKLYLKELETYFGKITTRDMGCVSTEARSSIPVRDNDPGGILAIRTNFFEFIPKEDIDSKNKRTLLCDGLEKGKEYYIVVTTAAGLYRYNIDDIVKVYDFFNKTPMIEFVQKGRGATSMAGEKLYESQVNESLKASCDATGLTIDFFCAVATPLDGPRYTLLAEFSGPGPSDERMRKFLVSLEVQLRIHNREYDFVRASQLLKEPVLKIVRKGSFEDYRARKISNGAPEGQFKAPRLTDDAEFEKNFSVEKTIPFG